MGEAMGDNDFSHTAEIMKAAIPYVDTKTKTTMDLFVKFIEFQGTYQQFNSKTGLAACGFEKEDMDLEALLSGIRPCCNDKEKGFVDMILNFFNTRRIFNTYKEFMAATAAASGNSDGGTEGSSEGSSSGFGSNNDMFGMLKAFLPADQMDTFENLSMVLNNMT